MRNAGRVFRVTMASLVMPLFMLAAVFCEPGIYAQEKNSVLREIHLYSIDGEMSLADGAVIPIMGFANYDDNFNPAPEPVDWKHLNKRLSVPGPTIRVKKGERVRVIHHNAGVHLSPQASGLNHVTHTIHFHGLDLIVPLDGVPEVPGNTPALEDGKSYTYDFTPDFEGTYSYHCHVNTASHLTMGMYGPFIVEGNEPKRIYGYKYDREYTLVLSEMDSKHNEAMRDTGRYNMLDFKGDYYLLNGRIFTSNLTNPLSTISDPRSTIVANVGETVLLRFLAFSYNHTFLIHPHGYHMQVIGTDGRKLPYSYEKDTLPVFSGERYDVLIKIGKKHKGVCTSCFLGPGLSIIHDHNMRGVVSGGKYPQGVLTVIAVTDDKAKLDKKGEGK